MKLENSKKSIYSKFSNMRPQNKIPKHVAIIMDGNGRWAKSRGLPRALGHKRGVKAVLKTVEACIESNVSLLTLYALSVENFKFRSRAEVFSLMELFSLTLERYLPKLKDNGIKLNFIGDLSVFSPSLLEKIQRAKDDTRLGASLQLNLALNYSGRWDLVQAAKRFSASTSASNSVQLSETSFAQYLSLADCPDPDLLIRTGGDQRLSNFLLWQSAYTELFFTQGYWPDFDKKTFQEAIEFYSRAERRFGRVKEGVLGE